MIPPHRDPTGPGAEPDSPEESARRLGVPVHDGDRCIGHVTHPHPAFPGHLHVVRNLVNDPRSLAFALSALDREELAILGRALMRHAA